jgi:hypothetical protein
MQCGRYNLTTCKGVEGVTYDTRKSIPEDAEVCAASVGLSWTAIDECVKSPRGPALLKASHFETMKLFAARGGYSPEGHGYRPPLIPNIWINSVQYNNPLVTALNPYHDIKGKVCAACNGTAPLVCRAD